MLFISFRLKSLYLKHDYIRTSLLYNTYYAPLLYNTYYAPLLYNTYYAPLSPPCLCLFFHSFEFPPMPDTTRTLFSEMSHYSSSDETESEPSDLFESDIYPLRGDDFAKLKEQLSKTRGFDNEL